MLKTAGIITLGDRVVVSDPCYSLGTWCQGILENVLPGEYNCRYNYDRKTQRVSCMSITHASLSKEQISDAIANTTIADFTIGVDSGTAGIFDYDYYKSKHEPELDDKWYGIACKAAYCHEPNPYYHGFLKTLYFLECIDKFIADIRTTTPITYCALIKHSMEKLLTAYFGKDEQYDSVIKERFVNADFWTEKEHRILPPDAHMLLAEAERKFDKAILNYRAHFHSSIYNTPTICTATGGIVDEKGFIAPSGFGDGAYDCWYHKNKNDKIDFIEIAFYNADLIY